MRRIAWLALLLLLPALGEIARLGRLPEEVNESSGLALSRRHGEVLWTLNDSGGAATLFAVGFEARSKAKVGIDGARNVDWESLAIDGRGRLWIADVGDNAERRNPVTIYRLPEPALTGTRAEAERIDLRYPDGSHNCEAVFVAGETLYLVTKTNFGIPCAVYSVDDPRPGRANTLTKRLTLTFNDMICGADISRDGQRIALCGYAAVYVYAGQGEPAELLGTRPHRLPLIGEQTEALAFDGYDLLVTSEQRSLVRIPAADYERAPLMR